jgi:hypothetical protein
LLILSQAGESEKLCLLKLDTAERLFPRVFIGFGDFFKKKKWRVIGNTSSFELVFPLFRKSFGLKPGKYDDWKIYDGKRHLAINELKPGMEQLEFFCGWSPQAIEKRIQTGENRYDKIL